MTVTPTARRIGRPDLLRALARTGALTFEEAYKISKFVLRHAGTNKNTKLDFAEYFTAHESLMTFSEYTKHIRDLDGVGIAAENEDHHDNAAYKESKVVWEKEAIPLLTRRLSRGIMSVRDMNRLKATKSSRDVLPLLAKSGQADRAGGSNERARQRD